MKAIDLIFRETLTAGQFEMKSRVFAKALYLHRQFKKIRL